MAAYVAGNLVKLLRNLPDDGRVHYLQRGLRTTDALDETRSSHAFLQRRADGRILVLARDGGSISAVGGIIGQALFWGLSLTLIPGLVGWHLLRRRPLRRVERLQRSLERIAPVTHPSAATRAPATGANMASTAWRNTWRPRRSSVTDAG